MNRFRHHLRSAIVFSFLIYCSSWLLSPNVHGIETTELLGNMKKSYSDVKDYQADVLVRRHSTEESPEERRFIYTFKRPEKMRIDFRSPNSGMVLVYPNKEGKVVVRPFPWIPFIKLHLDPDSPLISEPSGQRVDQTHLGLLIRNIERSLTIEQRGRAHLQESEKAVEISVPAEDHFRSGITTLYRFRIEKKSWLPVAVVERNTDGTLKREVLLRELKTNLGISDQFFVLEE